MWVIGKRMAVFEALGIVWVWLGRLINVEYSVGYRE
jgi:hypothetical protein